jgi:hypothetical protein
MTTDPRSPEFYAEWLAMVEGTATEVRKTVGKSFVVAETGGGHDDVSMFH